MSGRTKTNIWWNDTLAEGLRSAVAADEFWSGYLAPDARLDSSVSVHLAVLVEPYLRYIIEGHKTIESRFSMRRFAPYGQVGEGDVILLKRSGGPVVGLCRVAAVTFYTLDEPTRERIQSTYAEALCASDPVFWAERAAACYATLMYIDSVLETAPLRFEKRDRRGWVVLQAGSAKRSLLDTVD